MKGGILRQQVYCIRIICCMQHEELILPAFMKRVMLIICNQKLLVMNIFNLKKLVFRFLCLNHINENGNII